MALAPATYWTPKFEPPFELTVDEGWVYLADSADPSYLHFELADRPTSGLTFLHIDQLPTDACVINPPEPVVAGTSLTTWLRAQPGLTVGVSVVRLFGAVRATQLDVSAQDEGACEFGTPRFVSIKPFVSTPTCCSGFQLNVGEVARAYVFDMSDMLISAWAVAPTQAEADIVIPKAETLLGTIDFEGN